MAQRKVALTLMINDVKHRYKLDVETLCEELLLARQVRDKLYAIANNYFVYQPISQSNVDKLTISLKRLSLSYGGLIGYFNHDGDIDFPQQRIATFVRSLPTDSRGFNADFYQFKIQTLNKLLEVPKSEEDELPFAESPSPQSQSESNIALDVSINGVPAVDTSNNTTDFTPSNIPEENETALLNASDAN